MRTCPAPGGTPPGRARPGSPGFPGTTSATRYFKGASPRDVKLEADIGVGFDQGFAGVQVRQEAAPTRRGGINPRDTPEVITPQPRHDRVAAADPREWFGGMPLRSDAVAPADDTAGRTR